jgi:hypothetical protein
MALQLATQRSQNFPLNQVGEELPRRGDPFRKLDISQIAISSSQPLGLQAQTRNLLEGRRSFFLGLVEPQDGTPYRTARSESGITMRKTRTRSR